MHLQTANLSKSSIGDADQRDADIMKPFSALLLLACLVAQAAAIYLWISPRACLVACIFAILWFLISLVLLTRPPGIPEFVSDEVGSDEQYVIRKDVVPKLAWSERFRLALGVACGACLVVGVSMVVLAG